MPPLTACDVRNCWMSSASLLNAGHDDCEVDSAVDAALQGTLGFITPWYDDICRTVSIDSTLSDLFTITQHIPSTSLSSHSYWPLQSGMVYTFEGMSVCVYVIKTSYIVYGISGFLQLCRIHFPWLFPDFSRQNE